MTALAPAATFAHAPDVELDVGLDLALALTSERGWPQHWRPAPLHSGIACAVIDAIMSPHVRSETVAAVVARYQLHHSPDGGPEELQRSFHRYGEHWADLIGTRNRAWRSTLAPLKSEVIENAADLLADERVVTRTDLLERAHDEALRKSWADLPGQATGATWRHLLLVVGYRDLMVCNLTRGFIRRHVPYVANCASDREIMNIMGEVARTLSVPVQDIDHQMWRAGARGRQLG